MRSFYIEPLESKFCNQNNADFPAHHLWTTQTAAFIKSMISYDNSGSNGRRTRARGNLSKRTPSSSTWKGGIPSAPKLEKFSHPNRPKPCESLDLPCWNLGEHDYDLYWWMTDDLPPKIWYHCNKWLIINYTRRGLGKHLNMMKYSSVQSIFYFISLTRIPK